MKLRFLLPLLLLGATPLRADVVNLSALKDTMIQDRVPDNADGGGAGLFVGTDGDSFRHRTLIAFDVSGIPAGSTITNVQLTLYLGQVAGSGGGNTEATNATISLHPLTRNWNQGTAGNPMQSGGLQLSGAGYAASPGDATWNSAASGVTAWTTAGGDYVTTASVTQTFNTNTLNIPYQWSSPQMAADVQGWLSNSATNFGWELINADEKDARTFYCFYSSEWHNFTGGSAALEPVLQVTYTPPSQVPVRVSGPWWAVALLGILSLRSLHRRARIAR